MQSLPTFGQRVRLVVDQADAKVIALVSGQHLRDQRQIFQRLLAPRQLPDARFAVAALGGQPAAVRHKLRMPQRTWMFKRRRNRLARTRVPNPHRPILRGRNKPPPIRAEGGIVDLILVAQRRQERLAALHVPNHSREIFT